MTHIQLITPVSVNLFDQVAVERVKELGLPPDVEVECVSLDDGPASVETLFDEAFSAASLIKYVMNHCPQLVARTAFATRSLPGVAAASDTNRKAPATWDAIVVNCFADPAVDALRELLDIPIVGAGSASIHLAATFAETFSIISVDKNSVPHARRRLAVTGLTSRVCSVYGVDIPVLNLHGSKQATVDAILEHARKAKDEDGADAIVLGCTGMADVATVIESEIGIPVVEPTSAAVWNALTMHSLRLSHGRNWMYKRAEPEKRR